MYTPPEYEYDYSSSDVVSSSSTSAPTAAAAAGGGTTFEHLVKDGFVAEGNPRKVVASTQYEWDPITNFNVEEHFLKIERMQTEDQGLYICQVRSKQVTHPNNYSVGANSI